MSYNYGLSHRDPRSQLFEGVNGSSSSIGGAAQPSLSRGPSPGGYRAATPNAKGQYADSVMDSLESQNDEAIEGLSAKVKMIKDVQRNNYASKKCLIHLVVRCHWDRSARFQ